MRNPFWAFCALAALLTLILVGCQTDTQRIRATNEAIHTPGPTATSTPLIAEIQSIDIQEGDCIISTLPEGVRIDTVEIVPCTDMWEYRALNSFSVSPSSGSYPTQEFFSRQAYENCDRGSNVFLYPLEDAWKLNDRTITCLQESFGLSTSDPAKLNRLVSEFSLRVGECYNAAPETRNEFVELVNCSSDWEFRIVDRTEFTEVTAYPGEDFFERQASEQCPASLDFYLYPTSESWEIGDRALLCIEQGF